MRLIDSDELLKGKEDHQMISTHLIWNAPTIDAVPVVRCKDCIYCEYGECIIHQTGSRTGLAINEETDPNGYCHRAERKKE